MNNCKNCGRVVKNKYCNVSCQNHHQGTERADIKYGKVEEFKVNCCKCKKAFTVEERSKLYPQKIKYYCSRKCANSRKHSQSTKDKISKTLEKQNFKCIKSCKACDKPFYITKSKTSQIFCSRSCSQSYRMNNRGGRESCRKGGLNSARIQSEERRSMNEKYFYELCDKEFNSVDHNKQIFNGWDADVIIHDIKYAILWNGAWHYKKITKRHSVKQVKNRDKIKIEEITNLGYTPYIIKDMGRHNKEFVESMFKYFMEDITH